MAVTVTIASFRAAFPEFDVAAYPDPMVQFQIDFAALMLNPVQARWGNVLNSGAMLMIAHYLVLEKMARKAAAAGGVPGASFGVMSSKSVGPISVSYDTTLGISQNAGFWNLSAFGLQFWNLIRMFGAGPIQL